jgi:hypothetical protein
MHCKHHGGPSLWPGDPLGDHTLFATACPGQPGACFVDVINHDMLLYSCSQLYIRCRCSICTQGSSAAVSNAHRVASVD